MYTDTPLFFAVEHVSNGVLTEPNDDLHYISRLDHNKSITEFGKYVAETDAIAYNTRISDKYN